ncbi:C-reactive protein 1.1-like [Oculina patagonica]
MPLSADMQRFTLCFWMMTADQDRGTPFSYAITSTENELTIKKDLFYINGYYVNIPLGSYYNGIWHHVCMAWANANGSWKLTIDGIITDSGTSFQAGHVINGGGVVVIGQDQDYVLGGFQYSESFVGSISGMNLWSTVLPQDEVLRMSETCNVGIGNVLQWSDFENKIHGDVILEDPSSCQVPNA